MTQETKFETWAIVEVMGHQRYIGFVTEQVIAGTGFIRVDIPETEGCAAWTKVIGTTSIYAITPIAEDIARKMAAAAKAKPVNAWDVPKRLTTMDEPGEYDLFDEDDES